MTKQARLVDAQEVEDRLCISKRTAYHVIQDLNDDIARSGKRILAGKVDERYFEKMFFTDLDDDGE